MFEYLVDTNILTGITDRVAARHSIAVNSVQKLYGEGHSLHTSSQNLMEFWRVATRPIANNGLGLSPTAAYRELTALENLFPRLPDTDDVYSHWRYLVTTTGVSGVQVHDARLVAVMLSHGITHVLTFNVTDFARYAGPAGIIVIDPVSV